MRILLAIALLSQGLLTFAIASQPDVKQGGTTARPLPGTRLVYDIHYSNASVADFASLAGATKGNTARKEAGPAQSPQSFKSSLKGSLTLTVLSAESSETLLALAWHDVGLDLSYNEVKATSDEDRIRTALSYELYAAVDSEGRIVRLEFAPGVDATSQGCVRAVLTGFQFVTQAAPVLPKAWDTEEEDANGIYVAHYEAGATDEATPTSQVFTKKKVKYLARLQPPGSQTTAVPLTIVPEGETHLRRESATGQLTSVLAKEHQVISLSGRTLADSKSELTLILTKSSAASDSDIDELLSLRQRLSPTLVTTSLYETKRNKAAESHRREQILRGTSADSLLENLIATESAATSDQANSELAEKLEALLLLYPQSCRKFESIIAKSARGSTSFRLLITVLSRVGNAEAQALLRHGLRSRAEEKTALILLIHALSSLEAPDAETEVTLREIAFGSDLRIADAAQLGLGTLAGRLANTYPQRGAELVRDIADHIQSWPAPQGKTRLLAALGNARTAEAAAVVQHYLDGSNPELREAALAVMLRMQPDRADAILTKHLLDDASESVRVAAARELASRNATASTFSVQKKVFLSDATPNVRTMLLSGLWHARNSFPEATTLVTRAAKHDSSPEVRRAAEQLLGTSLPST